ncbi:helix-turn-helix domain-containing protein [Sphingomonas sp. BAUL-RG-20F-R05-02]|uniref:helix-turn-helix domain-containing protein n=1 Tax=Sphingomonas sp. BAUL-RG-20F-R05-02 TaxID=2914830 RepID=UPI001F55AB9C|nr:helix-turn-helix transcriptional regulator [Sphingomonas sp. BAUL-RG-20F-R05-02]
MQQRCIRNVSQKEISNRSKLPLGFVGFRNDLGGILGSRRRDHFGGSQQALADAAGISRVALCRIEKGTALPRPDTIDALMRILDLDWSQVAVAGTTDRVARPFDGSWCGDLRLELGRAVRSARRRQALTLRALGNRCGISASQLSRLERGEGHHSRAYEEHPDDAMKEKAYRRVRFKDPTLRRMSE